MSETFQDGNSLFKWKMSETFHLGFEINPKIYISTNYVWPIFALYPLCCFTYSIWAISNCTYVFFYFNLEPKEIPNLLAM